jgi:Flp pilus assembly protein TadG
VIKLLLFRLRRSPSASAAAPKDRGSLRRLAGDLLRDARASVLVFMAVGMLALGTATGVGIDFARGLNFKQALQGAADAAAIAGASVYLNAGYSGQATTAATNYLATATANLPTNNGVTSSIALSSSSPWTVTVNAKATINSSFNGLLENTIPVSVTATATGPTNPNIDFYLLLDSSPSMGIAATQAGINTMVSNTQGQCDSAPAGGSSCGCAFACHESHPSSESYFIPTGTGNPQCKASNNYAYCSASGTGNPSGEDNYALARALGVTLRIDNLQAATQNLMTTAKSTSTSNSATYRVAIYTFDVAFNTIQALTSNLTTASSSAANIAQLKVYSNNYLTSSNDNSDADTDYDNAMTNINSTMPNPGGGTKVAGDTPQEVLFFVTDGVEDETVNGSRQQSLMSTSWCNTIKNRGIRIAVLYTTYYPLTTNGWYNSYISGFQSQIASNMQSCASPGLFFQVDTGGDISAAMTALFNSAVQSAYISH